MTLRVGSLCTGYSGFELGLTQAGIDHQLVFVSEIDAKASEVLAARVDAPNVGDFRTADLPEIDLLTAGFPCQDISTAGHQKGLDGDKSSLWFDIASTISDLRPRCVLLENVSAILANGGPVVVATLTGLGYDCRWATLRASDIGAPHQRNRWFCLARDTQSGGRGLPPFAGSRLRSQPERQARGSGSLIADADSQPTGRDTATIPKTETGRENEQAQPDCDRPGDGSKASSDADDGRWNGGTQDTGRGSERRTATTWGGGPDSFGQYWPAVQRWETFMGRPAPVPARDNRLNPEFVEWMMGLPQGWVTGTGISHSAQLRVLGNGIVPQQAAAFIRSVL